MNIDLTLDAKFAVLFEEFRKVQAELTALKNNSQTVSTALQNGVKKTADETLRLNNAVNATSVILAQVATKAPEVAKVGTAISGNASATNEFQVSLSKIDAQILKLAESSISEAQKFSQGATVKEIALAKESARLQELIVLSAKAADPQGAKIFSQAIDEQTQKVRKLTEEFSKGVIPDQQNPFEKAEAGVISIKQQIRQARDAAAQAGVTYGEWSPQFAKATKNLALLKDRMDQINKTASAFNPDEKLKGVTLLVRGAVGGFSAVQGAMAFLGTESEDVARSLQKVQGLLLFSQGINEVLSLGDSIKAVASQLGIYKANQVEATVATEASTVADGVKTAALKAEELAMAKTSTQAKESIIITEELKAAKLSEAAITTETAVAAEVNAVAQTTDAAATEANAVAQGNLAGASQAAAASQTEGAVAAEANTVAQAGAAVSTEAAGAAAATATGFFARLWAVMLANPLIALAAGAVALFGIFKLLSKETESATEEFLKFNEAQKAFIELQKQQASTIDVISNNKIRELEATKAVAIAERKSAEFIRTIDQAIDLERFTAAEKRVSQNKKNIETIEKNEQELNDRLISQQKLLVDLQTKAANGQKSIFDAKSNKNIPIKDAIDATKKYVELISTEYAFAKKTIEDFYKTTTELSVNTAKREKEVRLEQLSDEQAFITARLTLDKVGSGKQLQDQLALIENERKTLLEAEQLTSAQVFKINAEAKSKELKLRESFATEEINSRKALAEAELLITAKEGREELNLKLKLLDEEDNLTRINTSISEDARKAAFTKTANERILLNREFAQRQVEDQLTIEINSRKIISSIQEEGSREALNAQLNLISAQESLDKKHAENTITDYKKLVSALELIDAESDKARLDAHKEFIKREIELQTELKNRRLELENISLSSKSNDSSNSVDQSLAFQRKILINEKEIIKNRVDGLNEQLDKNIISETDYQKAIFELEKQGAQNAADLDKNSNERLKNAIGELVDFAKTAFPQLANISGDAFAKMEAALLKVVKAFKDGKISIKDAVTAITGIISGVTEIWIASLNAQTEAEQKALDAKKRINDELISSLDQQISAKENEINKENELNQKGFANNLALKTQELAELKRQKEAALAQEKILKDKQIAIQKEVIKNNAIAQASQLILAAANILLSFSNIPYGVGIALAAAVIAGMYSIFANAQKQTDALTASSSLEHGGEIDIKGSRSNWGEVQGRRHSDQGGHRIEDTNIFVEDGEIVSHRKASKRFRKLLIAANKENFSAVTPQDLFSLPGINFHSLKTFFSTDVPELNSGQVDQVASDKNAIQKLEVSIAAHDTSTMEEHLLSLKAELKDFKTKYFNNEKITYHADGTEVRVKGNTTRIIRKK